MKKIVFLSLICLCFACDDGDLQIETLDFDSVDPQTCVTLTAENAEGYVLFKINGDEALILELPATAFKNEVVIDAELEVSATGSTTVSYRIFDDTVSSDYFCSAVPLGTPLLLEEIPATEGKIFITTSTTDDITFTHTISLSGISLETGTGQRITDLRINEFGILTTTIPTETP